LSISKKKTENISYLTCYFGILFFRWKVQCLEKNFYLQWEANKLMPIQPGKISAALAALLLSWGVGLAGKAAQTLQQSGIL